MRYFPEASRKTPWHKPTGLLQCGCLDETPLVLIAVGLLSLAHPTLDPESSHLPSFSDRSIYFG
jgi:hypothetical protein